jgi:hypothetical protein
MGYIRNYNKTAIPIRWIDGSTRMSIIESISLLYASQIQCTSGYGRFY